ARRPSTTARPPRSSPNIWKPIPTCCREPPRSAFARRWPNASIAATRIARRRAASAGDPALHAPAALFASRGPAFARQARDVAGMHLFDDVGIERPIKAQADQRVAHPAYFGRGEALLPEFQEDH